MNSIKRARASTSVKNIRRLFSDIRKLENLVNNQLNQIEKEREEIARCVDQRYKLVSDAIHYMNEYIQIGRPTSFEELLKYYFAVGNFNAFYDNYDVAFTDPVQIANWINHVKTDFSSSVDWCMGLIKEEEKVELEKVYNILGDEKSRDIYVRLVVWKILGFTKIKIISDKAVEDERNFMSGIHELVDKSEGCIEDVKFKLNCFNLNKIGFPIKCFAIPESIVMDFIRNQYEYDSVKIEDGDYIIDCGACWGDTALLFAQNAGENGKVFSFEFVPSNINIFNKNMQANPRLSSNIVLVEYAVSNENYKSFEYFDNGTSTSLCIEKDEKDDVKIAQTITIDEYIKTNKIPKVDFIKMDIEGAELDALLGCKETILKYKPKLAISIYHGYSDIRRIPLWIKETCPEYKLFIKHNSRSSLETILFAKVD